MMYLYLNLYLYYMFHYKMVLINWSLLGLLVGYGVWLNYGIKYETILVLLIWSEDGIKYGFLIGLFIGYDVGIEDGFDYGLLLGLFLGFEVFNWICAWSLL